MFADGGCGLVSCASVGAACGPISDGCGGLLDCGACPIGEVCGANVCTPPGQCTPASCAEQGLTCGLAGDGCGGLLNCGTCEAPLTCGGGGVAGQCGGPGCFCASGGAISIDYPSPPGDCASVMLDCFGSGPGAEFACHRRTPSDGGLLGQPGATCRIDDDCTCDLACVTQYGQGACALPCTTLADCPQTYTVCVAGFCETNFCGGAAGNGTFSGPCASDIPGDSTCLAPPGGATVVVVDGGMLGVCEQGGNLPLGAFCDPGEPRGHPGGICQVGELCLLQSSGTGRCTQVCDPTATDAGCPGGKSCQPYSFAGPQFGTCQ